MSGLFVSERKILKNVLPNMAWKTFWLFDMDNIHVVILRLSNPDNAPNENRFD